MKARCDIFLALDMTRTVTFVSFKNKEHRIVGLTMDLVLHVALQFALESKSSLKFYTSSSNVLEVSRNQETEDQRRKTPHNLRTADPPPPPPLFFSVIPSYGPTKPQLAHI